ncbi:MAG: MFS transporter [Betaproteobacteria bacterium]|nr:MFS transporter [Betaproteobacteria bacterium]
MLIWFVVLLCFLTFGSFIGVRVLVSLHALNLGASQATVGVLVAAFAVFPLLLSVYAGRIVDRVGAAGPTVIGTVGFVGAVLIPWFFPTLPALYLAASACGLALVFYGVATQQLVATLNGPAARSRNVSYYAIGIAASGFAGPVFVGYFIDHHGHRSAYLALGVLLALASIALRFVQRRVPPASAPAHAAAKSSMRDVLRARDLRLSIMVAGIAVAGIDLYTFYMPIYGHGIKLSATQIGYVMGAQALAALLVRVVMPRLTRRLGDTRLMMGALIIAGAAFLVFPAFEGVTLLILISFVLGLGLGCGQPLSMLMVYNRAPQGRAGEVLGVRFTVINFMHLVIPATFGALSALIGIAPVFAATALLMWVGSALAARVPPVRA